MQNYYRFLGLPPTASPTEIGAAYQRQRARLLRLVRRDRHAQTRLEELETAQQILLNPRRRLAYDQLLREEPDPQQLAREAQERRLLRYARVARSINLALLAGCLLLFLDWALPLRQLPGELVVRKQATAVSAYRNDPHPTMRIVTRHTQFELVGAIGHRVQLREVITVWQTPLLGVVRRVQVPTDAEPFQPSGGNIYGNFAPLPLLLLLVTAIGSWPGRPAETYINTAAAAVLLAVVALVILLWY
ncbi:hypothetical protein Q5H93_17805 [Hymenobacter sp. ASUV-10]|uniref:J domain-containing protein n=1 Tax=Hymenobacter aranciens TaxID=3063996 RepID=A0ABT9BEA9_9BACT|nr:DnaJ domain-containing protein [Hymenobacter sp. ASUV-10]MDO7876605.1 hypothetical protein [Hymenobacter sp. ASUV-10]